MMRVLALSIYIHPVSAVLSSSVPWCLASNGWHSTPPSCFNIRASHQVVAWLACWLACLHCIASSFAAPHCLPFHYALQRGLGEALVSAAPHLTALALTEVDPWWDPNGGDPVAELGELRRLELLQELDLSSLFEVRCKVGRQRRAILCSYYARLGGCWPCNFA